MFEISYTTSRLAVVDADDAETAKRRFAAYALYDDVAYVRSDVEVGFGEDAELAPHARLPATGTREEMRAWLRRHDDATERFEPSLYEERERGLEASLRALATNDPWRLEGHGYLGVTLSARRAFAELTTFDGRIRYRFDATRFVDYLRADVVFAVDPARPHESLRVAHLVDVSGLADEGLRQIASSYDAVARELALTRRFTNGVLPARAYEVTFDAEAWRRYVEHRRAEPERFLPPPGWTPAYAPYDGG